jgi:JmjC domain
VIPEFRLPDDFAESSWRRSPLQLRWDAAPPFDRAAVAAALRRAPGEGLSFEASDVAAAHGVPSRRQERGRVSILSRLDRRLPASRAWLAPLYAGIEAAVGHHPGFDPTAFLQTPSAGMEPHFDTGDVFSIQLEGRKRWSLYSADLVPPEIRAERERLPLAGGGSRVHRFYQELSLPEPRGFELGPGEVLYVPACWIHQTFSPEGSLSVSVSPRVLALSEWAGEALAMALDASRVQSYGAVGPALAGERGILEPPGEAAQRAAERLRASADPRVLEQAWYCWQSRGWFDPLPPKDGPLDGSDVLGVAPGVRLILPPDAARSGSSVPVYVAGRALRVPTELLPGLEACARDGRATVEERVSEAVARGVPAPLGTRAVELLHRSGFLALDTDSP